MYFSWLNVEIGRIYRQECMEQARRYRLARGNATVRSKHRHSIRRSLAFLGRLLETLGRSLQGIQRRDREDLPHIG